jgi:hypothetical protein
MCIILLIKIVSQHLNIFTIANRQQGPASYASFNAYATKSKQKPVAPRLPRRTHSLNQSINLPETNTTAWKSRTLPLVHIDNQCRSQVLPGVNNGYKRKMCKLLGCSGIMTEPFTLSR